MLFLHIHAIAENRSLAFSSEAKKQPEQPRFSRASFADNPHKTCLHLYPFKRLEAEHDKKECNFRQQKSQK